MSEELLQKIEAIKTDISNEWNWLDVDEIDRCYNYALSDYIMYKYPSENNRPTPDTLDYDYFCLNWISKRMRDILSRAGGLNVTSYKENGMNWTYASSYIDDSLLAILTRKAGIPK